LEITLNIKFDGIRGDKNIQQSLKFSCWCLAEEAVEQIVPFFLKQDIIECNNSPNFPFLAPLSSHAFCHPLQLLLTTSYAYIIFLLASPTEVETNFMSYSLFLGDKYLHKDKSLVELELQDGV
jgi:hypothetical protein